MLITCLYLIIIIAEFVSNALFFVLHALIHLHALAVYKVIQPLAQITTAFAHNALIHARHVPTIAHHSVTAVFLPTFCPQITHALYAHHLV